MEEALILPRIVGAFYLASGIAGIHAMAMDSLMDKVLAALTLQPTPKAEAIRRWMLVGGSFAVGLSGAALMVLSIWAVPLFLIASGLQLGWLVWARKGYPVTAEIDTAGRRQTTNAAIIFGVMTVLVTWLGVSGSLQGWNDPWALFIPAVAVALGAFALRHLLWKTKSPPAWYGPDERDDDDDLPLPPRPERIRIDPTWGGHDILDAATGVPFPYFDHVPSDLADRIHYWTLAFRAGDDHVTREFWVEFESPADEAAHRLEGNEIASELTAIFGEGNVIGPIYPADVRYVGPDPKAPES